MKIYAPSYYKNFKCIKDNCKNNCCIGWQIDIDENTLKKYKKYPNITKNISFGQEPHFILGENNRCPFLNSQNLCNIIIDYGEDFLCEICTLHPRFKNFFKSKEEIGLGLACEAAAKIILDNDFSIIKIGQNNQKEVYDTVEEDFFEYRKKLLNKNILELLFLLPKIPLKTIAKKLIKLERLNTNWENYLNGLKDQDKCLKDIEIKDVNKINNLLKYFIFRHLHTYGLEFCVFSAALINAINGDIYEIARLYSCEIEYSDQNIQEIIKFL